MIIKNAKIFTGEKYVSQTAMRVENGKIVELLETSQDISAIDAKGMTLSPGFIDSHMHGIAGHDSMDEGGIEAIAKELPKYGTTSFCPTSVSEFNEKTQQFLSSVKKNMGKIQGAQVIGAHLEGPFLSEKYRGAHRIDALQDPLEKNYQAFASGYEDVIKRMTIAPEKNGALELIGLLSKKNIVMSIGHTDATYDVVCSAANAGATTCTHMFNVMSPLTHRAPGAVGALLNDDRFYVEFIADMIHIDKACVDLILRCKGIEKTFICTDSMQATGMPDGEYNLGTSKVNVTNCIARIDGKLAGSTLTMDKGIRNLVEVCKISLEKAIIMGTSNVANAMKINNTKGYIQKGFDADFVLLDSNLNVAKTFVLGECVFGAK